MKTYFIKSGYKHNLDENKIPVPYVDCKMNSKSYQVSVYKFAAKFIKSKNLRNCLDIGCGLGYKLVNYIYPICHDITGIEAESLKRYFNLEDFFKRNGIQGGDF